MTVLWTLGLIALWEPPAIVTLAYVTTSMRCLGGFLSSYDEKDDYVSYCWYGVGRSRSPCVRLVLSMSVDPRYSFGSLVVTYYPSSLV
jgi:predicted protein tyrosine phosphatase